MKFKHFTKRARILIRRILLDPQKRLACDSPTKKALVVPAPEVAMTLQKQLDVLEAGVRQLRTLGTEECKQWS